MIREIIDGAALRDMFLMGAAPLMVTGRVLKRRLEKAG